MAPFRMKLKAKDVVFATQLTPPPALYNDSHDYLNRELFLLLVYCFFCVPEGENDGVSRTESTESFTTALYDYEESQEFELVHLLYLLFILIIVHRNRLPGQHANEELYFPLINIFGSINSLYVNNGFSITLILYHSQVLIF